MIINIYMFFDRCAGTYISTPMLMPSDVVARRNLRILVNDANFQFKDLINDLQLFNLGSIDLNTGIITSNVQFMCNVIDFKEVE